MKITLDSPLDMHLHLREDEMLRNVAPFSAKDFSGAMIMPNLVPPIDNLKRLLQYKADIYDATKGEIFKPYLTAFLKNYTREELLTFKDEIIAIKLYPAGATTNSDGGVEDLSHAADTLKLMEELGIPLSVHGENPKSHVLEREKDFLPTYEQIAKDYPKLKIIMEHITCVDAVKLLDKYDNLYATLTVQHLLITFDDIAGGLLNPHLFCKPIAKTFEDRDALRKLAFSAHPKVMFGSDSAPHPKSSKEGATSAAGCFTTPIALPCLVELFEKFDALDNLQAFISDNAKKIYGINPPEKKVTLEKKSFIVPEIYGDVVPTFAGEEVTWSVVSE